MQFSVPRLVLALAGMTLVATAATIPASTEKRAPCYCLPTGAEIPDYATCDWCCSGACAPHPLSLNYKDVRD
jgi:hypothetical protein